MRGVPANAKLARVPHIQGDGAAGPDAIRRS